MNKKPNNSSDTPWTVTKPKPPALSIPISPSNAAWSIPDKNSLPARTPSPSGRQPNGSSRLWDLKKSSGPCHPGIPASPPVLKGRNRPLPTGWQSSRHYILSEYRDTAPGAACTGKTSYADDPWNSGISAGVIAIDWTGCRKNLSHREDHIKQHCVFLKTIEFLPNQNNK